MKLNTKWCSSLAKIRLTGPVDSVPYNSASALLGETFSMQLAYFAPDEHSLFDVELESELAKYTEIRLVRHVPVVLTGAAAPDDDVISAEPGLYPDLLRKLPENNRVPLTWNRNGCLWFTVRIPSSLKPGKYTFTVKFKHLGWSDYSGYEAKSRAFTLEVLPAKLPAQTLKYTRWFHADCLASHYHVPVFSEEHWRILGNFMKNAAAHGINLLLTPVFTPPLDTQVGGERPTVQLVKVTKTKNKYSFDFSLLERWVKLASSAGIRFFEISHLFTQWGAGFCPKIVATVNGKEQRIFGWDVASDSKEYTAFLDAFLPELVAWLKKNKLQNKVYFHCSDEPHADHLDSYSKASAILRKHLRGFKIMDALSNVEFYKNGLVATPVPSETHLQEFIDAGVKERWTYYCCGPIHVYSNQFIYMPSSRNRVMGLLCYSYGVEGFLHWGYNFYYAQCSLYPIDPYFTTDTDGRFPAGDAFVVYPGPGGEPEDSIRHEVFFDAIQDQRALQLLETKVPRETIRRELAKFAPDGKLTMESYPRGEKAMLAVRTKINQMIRKAFA